jgi:predicted AAA+ superfamily ATPase
VFFTYIYTMKRQAEQALHLWKDSEFRKPLLMYGARQVGKTWLMKYFGKNNFQNYLYINFEKEVSLRGIFEQDYNPQRIVKVLEIFTNSTIIPGETLIIFDEIQEAKGAITSLKYFNEELPQLHIIGAGSLLGIALKQQTSFPVGQVDFLYLNPLSFAEFLEAKGEGRLQALLQEQDWEITSQFYQKFIQLLKEYYFVGGMPEAVNYFIEKNDYIGVRTIQQNILNAYEQDFSKHAPVEIIPKIRMIWNTIVSQLSKENKKFIYGIIKDGARAKDYELALSWLEDYGLVRKVYRTKKAAFPIKSYIDLQAFKLYILDVGLLGAMANISPQTLIQGDNLFQEFKGSLTEQYVAQQIVCENQIDLCYWANDSGSAEIDFMFEMNGKIIPLEVKATENLQAKSLKTFAQKNPGIHCYRTSLSNFKKESWVTNIPLYALMNLNDLTNN